MQVLVTKCTECFPRCAYNEKCWYEHTRIGLNELLECCTKPSYCVQGQLSPLFTRGRRPRQSPQDSMSYLTTWTLVLARHVRNSLLFIDWSFPRIVPLLFWSFSQTHPWQPQWAPVFISHSLFLNGPIPKWLRVQSAAPVDHYIDCLCLYLSLSARRGPLEVFIRASQVTRLTSQEPTPD